MAQDTIVGNIVLATRLPNTVNGNPRYTLILLIDGGFRKVQTKYDGSVADDVKNIVHRMGEDMSDLLVFTFTRSDRLESVEPV